ncbi:hypothetical protein [Hyalangium versicolor]|uniref:hypothetical protein n=1 Tax=Hyalangium versicolor TaxID=2861190 RepID=UPI001CC8F455|nr:hypothetical protein [Hyalangium versicolor]
MRNTLATVMTVSVLCGTLAAAGAPVGSGKVYVGSEGESVAVIPLNDKSPKGDKQALIYVQGTDTDFDGKPLPAIVSEQGPRLNYITQYKGEDFYVVQVRESRGTKSYDLWVPNRRDGIRVSYDDKRTLALKADDVYSQYEKLKKDGTLTKLSAYNRPERESQQLQGFTEVVKSMNDACGTQVKATIDWKSVTDDIIKRYSIASFCGGPLESLRKLCEYKVGKKIIQAKVKTYACQFGSELKLDVKSGTVNFITQQDAPNQEEYATQFFEKNL